MAYEQNFRKNTNETDIKLDTSSFAINSGYLQYAAANDIVVLFPQGQWDQNQMFKTMKTGKVPNTIKSIHEMILALEKPYEKAIIIED